MSNPNEDSLHVPNLNHNVNPTYIYPNLKESIRLPLTSQELKVTLIFR